MKKPIWMFALCISLPALLCGVEIVIHKKDATVWSQELVIIGEVTAATTQDGILYLDDVAIPFTISATDSFAVPIRLEQGTHAIYAEIDNNGTPVISETVHLTLGYKIRPETYLYATVEGRTINLHCEVIDNPGSSVLTYEWSEDPDNPTSVGLATISDTLTSVSIPEAAPSGEYYFEILATEPDGDQARARTYVTVTDSGITPFNIRTDHAGWIDSAVIYEITPHKFVLFGGFSEVQNKLPELVQLGVTAIWLQPIMETSGGGMGYGTMDYFEVRTDFGSEADLRQLITTAHNLGLRVLLDIVPNHTSRVHHYKQEADYHGSDSHYYHFYQREPTEGPYNDIYTTDDNGFYYYSFFYPSYPNINYDNPEVRRWMTEAFKYWIEEFDVDGYRFDAIWGVNARTPAFTQEVRLALKRIKPEILMLAEDKASWPMVFEERFDAAFDWIAGEEWVSQPMWEVQWGTNETSYTIFNYLPAAERAGYLRNALTNFGNGFHQRAKILRFMDNNDTYYFITNHTLEQTKMVAAMMFSLNGIPMMYNGQEIGKEGHAWSGIEIFKSGQSIQSLDNVGLFPYYQKLIALRKRYHAFWSDNFEELAVDGGGSVFAYRRWELEQNAFCIMNMDAVSKSVNLSLPTNELDLNSTRMYYLTELLTGEVVSGLPSELASISMDLPAYSTSLYLLQDTVVTVMPLEVASSNLPRNFSLSQNYPNPFNPVTVIAYTLPTDNITRLAVYDLMGREVLNLVSEYQSAGSYSVRYSGKELASGVYLYRLQFGEQTLTRKMLLLK